MQIEIETNMVSQIFHFKRQFIILIKKNKIQDLGNLIYSKITMILQK